MPTPEWLKELLAEVPKAEASVPVPKAENKPMPDPMPAEEYEADLAVDEAEVAQGVLVEDDPSIETDVPADVQDEIRGLAASMAEALEVPEPESPEGDFEEETAGKVAAADEAEAEPKEQEPPEPPKPRRLPRRFEFAIKASSLKAFLAHLEHLVDEARVHATEDGWHVLAVDPAHVAMVDLTLTDLLDAFERVPSTNTLRPIEEGVEFGIDVTKMKEVLRLAKKDDTVLVIVDLPDTEDKDRITVEIGRTKRTMSAINTADMSDPKVPALNLPAKLTVRAEDLLEAVKACESISDHVRLTATRDGLNILAEGDVDKVSMDFEADVAYVQGEEGKVSSLFPLDYLSAFVKAAKVGPLVVQLGTDYPIRMDWDGTTKGIYMLAPRIETTE